MRKKLRFPLLTMLLCLMLAHAGLAQTVPEMVQAPGHINDRFTSNTGKTVIEVDAEVVVPDAEAAYVLPVTVHAFDQEWVARLAHTIHPEIRWESTDYHQQFHSFQLNSWFCKNYDPRMDTLLEVSATSDSLLNGQALSALLSFRKSLDYKQRNKGHINYFGGAGLPITGEGIPGHRLTTAEAIAVAESFLAKVSDEPFQLFTASSIHGIRFKNASIKEEENFEGQSYQFTFTRAIKGMPVLAAWMSLDPYNLRDIHTIPVGYEHIQVVLNEEGEVSSFKWYHRYRVDESGPKESLLPFYSILDIARKVLPLKFTSKEGEEPQEIHINRITLGYMPVFVMDQSKSFMLVPVWNFYGVNQRHFEKYPFHTDINDAHLTINAIKGTVIDLEYGY